MGDVLKGLSASIYSSFAKFIYPNIFKNYEKEEIYHKDGKYFIFVEDEEIGNRLFDVVKYNDIFKEHLRKSILVL